MQLGALVAAGHAPRDIMDWTWPQIEIAATAVQAYHHDLAARLISGKSPTMEAAVQEAARQASVARDAAALPAGLDRAARAAMAQAAEDRQMAAAVAGMGFAVNTAPAAPPDGMALFLAARAAKARGEDPEAVIRAGVLGTPATKDPGDGAG